MKVFGIVGWKNSGKTTMVANLVRELKKRRYSVSTIKHAHHTFDVDHPNTDSFKHREAGADQVALVSRIRTAIMHELGEASEPTLEETIGRIQPTDFVIFEGFKNSNLSKMEMISSVSFKKDAALWQSDSKIVAVGTALDLIECPLPKMNPDAISQIADFVENYATEFDHSEGNQQ